MARVKSDSSREEIFPNVSNSIFVVLGFWIWMFGIIASSSATGLKNQYGAVNPTVMFSLGLVGLLTVAFREAENSKQLIKALGLRSPVPGFGLLSFFNGLGVGILLYTVFTRNLLSIAGSASITSIAQPFYNPYTASATPFLMGSISTATFGILFINAYVAVFEEAYKIGMYKITSDWIYQKSNRTMGQAMAVSLFITFLLWGLWHYFSWDGLTLASVVMAVMYGIFFIASYVVLASTGLLPTKAVGNKELGMMLSSVIIFPNIGSHWAWNVLVGGQGLGISTNVLIVTGLTFFVMSIVGMWLSRKVYG